MFEVAEVGNSLSRDEYKTLDKEIHALLLNLQQQLRRSDKSMIIIVSGVEGAGKGEVVDCLNRWFDTRDVQTHAFWEETDEERQRPRFWRFWKQLPARGSIAMMFGSWYSSPLVEAAFGRIDELALDRELHKINALEQLLSIDGTIIVKLWFHLPKSVQKQRLELDANVSKFKRSPLLDEFSAKYDQFRKVSEHSLRNTDSGVAPWHIIEATDAHYRDIRVGEILLSTLNDRLGNGDASRAAATTGERPVTVAGLNGKQAARTTILDTVDLSQTLSPQDYRELINEKQRRLYDLSWEMHRQRRNAVLVFEGWDAAGKGSAIRRLTMAMDARLYRVIPVAAPTDEELAHHYLWRFWRQVPRAGYMTIYDRSWYGRVLVERVEGYARAEEWLRSYREINEFEGHLVEHGIVLCKFWVHISEDEQLRRFKEREEQPHKQHKITEEDWRNREKWQDYQLAVSDMVAHTSSEECPWTLIAGNDKYFARIQILDTVCERLAACLGEIPDFVETPAKP